MRLAPRLRALVVPAAAASLLAFAAAAQAAMPAGWADLGALTPVYGSAPATVITATPDNSTWRAWITDNWDVKLRRTSDDGTDQPATTLYSGTYSEELRLFADSDGNAIVGWQDQNGDIQLRKVSEAGTVTTIGSFATNGSYDLGQAADGTLTLIYTKTDSTTSQEVLYARHVGAGGAGPEVQISTDTNENVEDLHVSTNSAGDSVISWGYGDYRPGSFDTDIHGQRARILGADDSTGDELSLGSHVQSYDDYSAPVMTGAGTAYVAFPDWVEGQSADLKLARFDASSTAPDFTTLQSHDAFSSESPAITANAAGDVFVAWHDQNADKLDERTVKHDGDVVPPLGSNPAGITDSSVYAPALAALPDGDAMAAWVAYDDSSFKYVPQVATIDPDGGPASAVTIGDGDSDAGGQTVAVGPGGDVTVAWYQGQPGPYPWDPGQYTAHGALLDVTAPTVDSLVAPSAGTAGDEMVFAASGHDRTGVQSIGWDFGDGHSATGGVVSHSYSAPGSYDVTLTLTDGVGNTKTEKRSLTVRAVPSSSSGGDQQQSNQQQQQQQQSGQPEGNGSPTGAAGHGEGSPLIALASSKRTFSFGRTRLLVIGLPSQPVDVVGVITIDGSARGAHASRRMRIARRGFRVIHGTAVRVHVRVSWRAARAILRSRHSVRARMRVTLTGLNGKTVTKTYRVRIRAGH